MISEERPDRTATSAREKTYEIIFDSHTPAGKLFDIVLLVVILISVVATCLESVETYKTAYGNIFSLLEAVITILFTLEFALRIWCSQHKTSYLFSFYGIVDLLSILPSYIGIAIKHPGASHWAVIRSLRLLRVFRVFELGWFVSEANGLRDAVWKSRAKIVVFLFTLIIIVTLAGTIMYLLEGGQNEKLVSIPEGIYWAIVTMTTVGYGDVVATTTIGKIVSAVLILLGYSLIIVPTGFVSAEFVSGNNPPGLDQRTDVCPHCGAART